MNARHNRERSRFELEHAGRTAIAEYQRSDGSITLTHTEVPPEHRGQGIGDLLARTAFDYAREHRLKVVPSCPFMATWLRRHPEYQDLRA